MIPVAVIEAARTPPPSPKTIILTLAVSGSRLKFNYYALALHEAAI